MQEKLQKNGGREYAAFAPDIFRAELNNISAFSSEKNHMYKFVHTFYKNIRIYY